MFLLIINYFINIKDVRMGIGGLMLGWATTVVGS